MLLMKNKKILFSVVLFVLLTSFGALHKFYVSVTQIDFNEKKSRVEISTRIFIDDLEKALEKKHNQKFNLATKIEAKNAKELTEKYLLQKLSIKINGQEQSLVFLGSEYEDDVLICYLKIDNSKKITTFEVFNNVLTETYTEQQNIVHTNINNTKRSFLLTQIDKIASIKY